tara:strand:+ start:93 stop:749 length:657 start_codon:yes stop_codon:yes gene_type:complete
LSQLIFKFPFKTNYLEKDFFVSSNNFEAYKLIESWPDWSSKWINIYGPLGSGKTHLTNILKNKLKLLNVDAREFNEKINLQLEKYECLVIENFDNNIDEKLLYSSLNHIKQLNKNILINSRKSIKDFDVKLIDLKSRLNSFLDLSINLPTDDLIRVIILKSFSDKQINISSNNLEYILKNIDRSYEKISKFTKDIDDISLSTGKSIKINLIKKVLNNE